MRISDWSSDVCSSDLRSACPSARPRTLPCPARRSRRVPHHAAVAGEIVAAELRRLGGIGRRGAEREQALERRLEPGVTIDGEIEALDHCRQESEAELLRHGGEPWCRLGLPRSDGRRRLGFGARGAGDEIDRSEEHTSELQSLMRNSYAGF